MLAELVTAAGVIAGTWQSGPPLPVPRTEVAGAVVRGEIFIVGGYLANGQSSARVDVYAPRTQRWRRSPDLPVAVNHAMAASYRGRLYVVGGHSARGTLRSTYVLMGGNWRRLAPLAASVAAFGNRPLYRDGTSSTSQDVDFDSTYPSYHPTHLAYHRSAHLLTSSFVSPYRFWIVPLNLS